MQRIRLHILFLTILTLCICMLPQNGVQAADAWTNYGRAGHASANGDSVSFHGHPSSPFATLLFRPANDGDYWYDPQGSVTAIETDKNAEALLLGLPVGKYVLEETVVPEHFFAVPPINVEITVENTSLAPKEVYVTNTPTVKLGIDSDKFNLVIGIAATSLALLLFGGMYLLKRRKAK